jgi:peroxiredoxin
MHGEALGVAADRRATGYVGYDEGGALSRSSQHDAELLGISVDGVRAVFVLDRQGTIAWRFVSDRVQSQQHFHLAILAP